MISQSVKAAASPSLIRAAVSLLGFAVFLVLFLSLFDFGKFSQSGLLLGDDGDARFNGVVLEHWFQVFRGNAVWHSPSFFYPAKGVLGYSDGLVLYAPIYAVFRFAGADPYLALTATVLLLPIIGYLSLFAFFRKVIGLDAVGAFLLSAAAILSPNIGLGLFVFYQVLTIMFVPVALLLLGLGYQACASGRPLKGALLAFAGGAVAGLLALTSFYTFWFGAVIASLVVAIGAGGFVIAVATGAGIFSRAALADRLRPFRAGIGSALLGFVLSLIPSLIIYVPAALTRRFDAAEAWGRLITNWRTPSSAGFGDLLNYAATGLLPMSYGGTSLLAIVVLIYMCLSTKTLTGRLLWIASLGAVLMACLSRYRLGDFSLWSLFSLLPGGFAVRDPARFEVNIHLASVLVLGAAIAALMRRQSGFARYARTGVYALLLVLALDSWRRMSLARQALPHQEYFEALDFNPDINANCRAFFIGPRGLETQLRRHDNRYQLFNLDAAYIADRSGMPTLNGYSAFAPPGWSLSDPLDRCYLNDVDSWIKAHDLTGVCLFSYADRNFQPYLVGDVTAGPRCN